MRAVAGPGRWVWGVSGLVTAAALAIPGVRLIGSAGDNRQVQPQAAVTRTVTVTEPVSSLTVQSYGASVQVTTGSARRVQITETLAYDMQAGGPPAVTQSVSGGHLLLADPACSASDCAVSFAVTVPPGVAVTVVTDGGPLTVAGTAGANLDSGGGPVRATRIGGPLTVSTDGGMAALTVPGGPYALAADSGGGPESVGIATDPAAPRSITVSSGGGPLQIEPPMGGQPASPGPGGNLSASPGPGPGGNLSASPGPGPGGNLSASPGPG